MPSPSEPTIAKYTTRDMSMAAWLSWRGFTCIITDEGTNRAGEPQGSWMFTGKNAELDEAVRQYETGEALVEPAAYQLHVKRVRTQLFEKLGIKKRRNIR